MERKRSRSPHQLADSPSIERYPAYGHRHERLDQRIQMIDSTATAGTRRPFGIWLLELFWDLGFGIWSFPLCPILEQSCITFDQVACVRSPQGKLARGIYDVLASME